MKKYPLLSFFRGHLYTALVVRLGIAMGLFSLARILFYAFNADLYPDMTAGHLLHLLRHGLRFDLVAVLYTNIVFIVGYIIPFRFRHQAIYQRALAWIFYLTNSIALAMNCVDMAYFRFTMRRTTWSALEEFSNDRGNVALMGRFAAEYWYLFILLAALVAGMVWLYRRVPVCAVPLIRNRWIYYPVGTIAMAVSMTLFVGGVRGGFAYSTRPITISNAAACVNRPAEIGIVLSTPFSVYKTLSRTAYKRLSWFDSPEALEAVYSPVHRPADTATAFTPKNVVIIIVESLSKEYIGAFNRELDDSTYTGYTPFLDSLITHSYTFAHSFGNGLKSIDAMPSVLASIPSFPEPYVLSVYSNNTIRGLATLLAEKGYDCSFFHGAPNGSMGFDAFARMAGFQHYYGKNEYHNDADFDGLWAIWDEPFLQFMAQTLDRKTEPFFATVFTATSHHPFRVPKAYEGVFPKGTEEIHPCVGYTDLALRRFFATASQMPWFANTVFVITADHTNQVSYAKSKTAIGAFLIPVIYYDPSGGLAAKVEPVRVTQQIDIMPSLLGYLHYDRPYFAFGFDLFSADTTRNFAINFGGFYNIYAGDWVLQTGDDEPVALYNYEHDIMLRRNRLQAVAEAPQAPLQPLLQYFRAFHQQYNRRLIDNDMTVDAADDY
ncbi:MAG: LTA synthase family protein [Prevotellaceae bacterium]|jgi:arylsulfatase A-like enzyme|nr:LTA synthase family protein [Prevotellaceae bacterium]